MNQKIRFIDEIKELKKKNFKKIIVLDNEIRKINGIRIMGSSGY
jgi:hypothetical protein